MDSMLKDLFFLFFSPLAWLHLPVEYPFRVFRGTFIASLDTLTISPVICKYIHEKERERVCPGKDCFYRREAGLLPFHRARQTTTALSKRVVEPASPLYIFLLLARRKINLTRGITVPPLFQPPPLCSLCRSMQTLLVQLTFPCFFVQRSTNQPLTSARKILLVFVPFG